MCLGRAPGVFSKAWSEGVCVSEGTVRCGRYLWQPIVKHDGQGVLIGPLGSVEAQTWPWTHDCVSYLAWSCCVCQHCGPSLAWSCCVCQHCGPSLAWFCNATKCCTQYCWLCDPGVVPRSTYSVAASSKGTGWARLPMCMCMLRQHAW